MSLVHAHLHRQRSATTLAGLSALAGLSISAALALTPANAKACGGTFCDAGPQVMPVDQTGENILFVRDGAFVEAHIQIQYTGDPERFAWVIPVVSVPEISVGSQALFDNLLGATVPTFTLNTVFEDSCGGGGGPCLFAASDSAALGGDSTGFNSGTFTGGDEDGGPIAVARGVAGAFEYVVLEGGTVQGLVDWLDTNGYQQDADAPPILQEYLEENHLFVAVKLRSGAGVEEIQPLVIRYEGSEPCIPIRLTKIAAREDMGIRAFFLGAERVVPQNYAHVLINPAAIDWVGDLGSNYEQVVTMAVDEDGAEGHAFVTEYAGASSLVSSEGLFDLSWVSSAYATLEASQVVDQLEVQGLVEGCEVESCNWQHPLVRGLLATYIPVPAGINEGTFYGNLGDYADVIDLDAWDGDAFAADFEARIVAPGAHAVELLGDHSYLTRLYTTLSPNEMTKDPMFHSNGDLGTVSNAYSATQHNECGDASNWLELSDGRILGFDDQGNGPAVSDMPWALRVEMVPAMGAPQVTKDYDAEISDAIALWNRQNPSGALPGCACDSERGPSSGALWLGLALGAGMFGRRRRRR